MVFETSSAPRAQTNHITRPHTHSPTGPGLVEPNDSSAINTQLSVDKDSSPFDATLSDKETPVTASGTFAVLNDSSNDVDATLASTSVGAPTSLVTSPSCHPKTAESVLYLAPPNLSSYPWAIIIASTLIISIGTCVYLCSYVSRARSQVSETISSEYASTVEESSGASLSAPSSVLPNPISERSELRQPLEVESIHTPKGASDSAPTSAPAPGPAAVPSPHTFKQTPFERSTSTQTTREPLPASTVKASGPSPRHPSQPHALAAPARAVPDYPHHVSLTRLAFFTVLLPISTGFAVSNVAPYWVTIAIALLLMYVSIVFFIDTSGLRHLSHAMSTEARVWRTSFQGTDHGTHSEAAYGYRTDAFNARDFGSPYGKNRHYDSWRPEAGFVAGRTGREGRLDWDADRRRDYWRRVFEDGH